MNFAMPTGQVAKFVDSVGCDDPRGSTFVAMHEPR